MSKISLIVAMDENGLIGRNNDLPWRLPNDLAFFKRTTMGKPIVMGRKTWESIGKPLPGRKNVVVSRQADYIAEGCCVVNSLEAAKDACPDSPEIMVIGGAQVYEQAMETVERMYITRVHAKLQGDAWFPEQDWSKWKIQSREHFPADEKNEFPHSFEIWERL